MDWRDLSERASDVYKDVEFRTDKIFNEPPPKEWVSFMLGGIFALFTAIHWVFRYKKLLKDTPAPSRNIKLRAMIAAYIDNDNPFYTCSKLISQSFFFLGGLQWDYENTFTAMLAWFTFESALDALRILLAVKQATSLKNLVVASKSLRQDMKRRSTTELSPTNVYEDISRDKYIVFMVFITQTVLISFVVSTVLPSNSLEDAAYLYSHLFSRIPPCRWLTSLKTKRLAAVMVRRVALWWVRLAAGCSTYWVSSWLWSFCSVSSVKH